MKTDLHQSTFPGKIKNLLKKSVRSAKRRGAWFALDRKEKGLLSLAIRLEVKFSSLDLLRAITTVLKKLEERGDTLYSRMHRGLRLAWAFSEFAVAAGNPGAVEWRRDMSYVDYLGRSFQGEIGGFSYR